MKSFVEAESGVYPIPGYRINPGSSASIRGYIFVAARTP
jgi:hypothetical protein